MYISEQGIALIKKFEGFSAQAYLCPAGKWTIGYGHVLPQHALRRQVTIEQADKLLRKDLAPVETAINRLVKAKLTQNQFDALCSLTYNIGVGAFARSTLLKLLQLSSRMAETGPCYDQPLQKMQQDGVAAQFSLWVYGGGKRLSGLVARRKAEKELFEK